MGCFSCNVALSKPLNFNAHLSGKKGPGALRTAGACRCRPRRAGSREEYGRKSTDKENSGKFGIRQAQTLTNVGQGSRARIYPYPKLSITCEGYTTGDSQLHSLLQ
jgi:hypothetical protein